MTKELQVTNWIRNRKIDLDKIICDAGQEYYQNKIKNDIQLQYDMHVTKAESFNLSQGTDLCYDRPTIGFTYSLYYHAKRVNTFLNYFLKALINTTDDQVQIFDLGAGTGAVQYAIGLIYCGLKKNGYSPPAIKIINIDTSPFMLYYNRDYLWKQFIEFTELKDAGEIEVAYEINSWNNSQKIQSTNPWIVASYLFDHSENRDEIANDFRTIVNKFKPSTIALLTSYQPNKITFLDGIANSVKKLQYEEDTNISNSKFNQTLSGELDNVTKLRKSLNICVNPTKWDIDSLYGKLLRNINPAINFNRIKNSNSMNGISLFNPPIIVRRDIGLNEEQIKAAEINDRPTCITGPAGCGKSVVITEKIKNLVDQEKYNPELKILFTTFNKELVKVLVNWLKEILDKDKCKIYPNYKEFYIKFQNSNIKNIRILHFDILPTYIGGLQNGNRNIKNDKYQREKLKLIIENYRNDNKLDDNSYNNILNPDFIFEEFQRVVYGLQYFTESEYMSGERKGRGVALIRERRLIVWKVISLYLQSMKNENYYSFTSIRYMFLKNLYSNANTDKFDYVFVDEFQDCTKAEFEIFYNLIKDPNNLTVSGDLAQALQLGSSAHIPRHNGNIKMGNFDYKRLNGSYRLPLRICECIHELSNDIYKKQKGNRSDDSEVTSKLLPYKGAPPGARPIVVYGTSLTSIGDKIIDIFNKYGVFLLNKITILERDDDLRKYLSKKNINCESDSVLRIKGLEKNCILWTTSAEIDFTNEAEEFVYTILTRTNCLLIVALSSSTKPYYKNILKSFRKDRVICWDEESKTKFNELNS